MYIYIYTNPFFNNAFYERSGAEQVIFCFLFFEHGEAGPDPGFDPTQHFFKIW